MDFMNPNGGDRHRSPKTPETGAKPDEATLGRSVPGVGGYIYLK